ncbi:MAG: hypothetical protein H0X64_10255, partial [Gemmatimonadaceae bacterium]|nr:hypothetical protein [Gemmatimonadaceae bacterium]
ATSRALVVRGTVNGGTASPWAGAMWFPAAQPMQPADLSATGGFSFQAKGDGATYRVMVFMRENGMAPRVRTFVATADWAGHKFAWSDFGTEAAGILGIAIVAGPSEGKFELRLDELALVGR